ncbi:MAG: hypothetical protein AB7J30_12775 [Hyphomicrobium sp.]
MQEEPLTPGQRVLLQQLIDKLAHYERLLGLGKPGAKQLRHLIREERVGYQQRLLRDAGRLVEVQT